MVSTYVGKQSTVEKQRFFRVLKIKKMAPCPKAVDVYKMYMGGVDLIDWYVRRYYRLSLKSKKYYLKIIDHMLDLCVVNTWILYRKVYPDTNIPLVDFKLLIPEVLCEILKPSPRTIGGSLSSENNWIFV